MAFLHGYNSYIWLDFQPEVVWKLTTFSWNFHNVYTIHTLILWKSAGMKLCSVRLPEIKHEKNHNREVHNEIRIICHYQQYSVGFIHNNENKIIIKCSFLHEKFIQISKNFTYEFGCTEEFPALNFEKKEMLLFWKTYFLMKKFLPNTKRKKNKHAWWKKCERMKDTQS